VHHLLPPLRKCNNLRERGHPYEFTDFGRRTALARLYLKLNIGYKISNETVRQKVLDIPVNDLLQCLTEVWAAVKQSALLCPAPIGRRY